MMSLATALLLIDLTTGPNSGDGNAGWFVISADRDCAPFPSTPDAFAAALKDEYLRTRTLRDQYQQLVDVIIEAKNDRAWVFYPAKRACSDALKRMYELEIKPRS